MSAHFILMLTVLLVSIVKFMTDSFKKLSRIFQLLIFCVKNFVDFFINCFINVKNCDLKSNEVFKIKKSNLDSSHTNTPLQIF